MTLILSRDIARNINKDRKPIFHESLFKTFLLGLMVQGVRKRLSIVGDSRVHPGDGEQGRVMVMFESFQETRNVIQYHNSSDAVEMECWIADNVLQMPRTSVFVRERGLGTPHQNLHPASLPTEHHQLPSPLHRLGRGRFPQAVEGIAYCSRCTLQPDDPIGHHPKKPLSMCQSLRTDILLERLEDHSRL